MSKYSVNLKQEHRKQIEELVKTGTAPARKIMHAQILLKSDKGQWGPRWSDKQIQQAFGLGETVIKRVRSAMQNMAWKMRWSAGGNQSVRKSRRLMGSKKRRSLPPCVPTIRKVKNDGAYAP